jgi:HEXXH motif-containing protein
MDYFHAIDTALVMRSSALVSRMTTEDIASRALTTMDVPRTFAPIVDGLADCIDSPKRRHWVSVSRSLIRSRLKVLDPEPRFVSHFFVDALHSSRIGEIHAFKALEILLEHHLANGTNYTWEDSDVQAPLQFNLWHVGTIALRQRCRGVWVILSARELFLRFGDSEFRYERISGHTWLQGEVGFHQSFVIETNAGTIQVPLDVPGLADCFHSNAPIVRGLEAVQEWAPTFQTAVDILYRQDAAMASDCLQLTPAVLALHSGGTSYGSSSSQEVLGLVFLPGVLDPNDVAECLLHEALHQKLFRVEEGAPLFEEELGDTEIYYSPWRSDPRPLRMLVHGAFVFAGVSHFWKSLQQSCEDEDRENAGFHSYYRALQAQAAMRIVAKSPGRSDMGRKVSDIIDQGIEQALATTDISVTTVEEAHRRLSDHKTSYSRFVD